ncbi:MAG: cyoD [Sphingomonas bacterium]|uniref:cytochrome o ubiquinol oxidase subunit IV n=1 Tax=Sphingomonas bacterium TaxID=1895847 RepID=UPI002633D437|nr:cytochrome o ubiquinol oxidase subunit IV [Sphingomonas bacterium]MDB5711242.1 cyoD [Sphingomonas bacterium]
MRKTQNDDSAGHRAPGRQDDISVAAAVRGYLAGLALAALLTIAAFTLPTTGLVWAPAVPIALIALAVGQMGVHLVFFLHITSGPDNTNNILALAFGVLIIAILLGGTLWIMTSLDHHHMSTEMLQRMQR